MRLVRVLWRLPLFLALALVTYSLFLVGFLCCSLMRIQVAPWRGLMMGFLARSVVWITRCKLTVGGPIPEPPFVLVCNHMTYVDVVLLATVVHSVFVAKAEVRSWPVLGWLVRGLGTIFIDRTRRADVVRVNEEIARQLGDQQGLVIFPEGMATIGAEIKPLKPSLLAFPAGQGMPVWYATLTYRTEPDDYPAHQAVCWGDPNEPFLKHVLRFFSLKSYEADLLFGAEPVVADDRKVLAETLWQKMNAQFVPVVDKNSVEED